MFNRILWFLAYSVERWGCWFDRIICGWMGDECSIKLCIWKPPESAWRCDLFWRALAATLFMLILPIPFTICVFSIRYLVYLPIKWTLMLLFGYVLPGKKIYTALDDVSGRVSDRMKHGMQSAKNRWCTRVYRPGVKRK